MDLKFNCHDKESGKTFTFGFADLYGWDYGDVYIRNDTDKEICLILPSDDEHENPFLNPNLEITLK